MKMCSVICGQTDITKVLHRGSYKILVLVKVKVEFTLEQAMKAQGGSRGVAVLFL